MSIMIDKAVRISHRLRQTDDAENQQLSSLFVWMDNGNGFVLGQTCLEYLKQRKRNTPMWCLPKTFR